MIEYSFKIGLKCLQLSHVYSWSCLIILNRTENLSRFLPWTLSNRDYSLASHTTLEQNHFKYPAWPICKFIFPGFLHALNHSISNRLFCDIFHNSNNQQNSLTVKFAWEKIEGNPRWAHTEPFLHFRRANTETYQQ